MGTPPGVAATFECRRECASPNGRSLARARALACRQPEQAFCAQPPQALPRAARPRAWRVRAAARGRRRPPAACPHGTASATRHLLAGLVAQRRERALDVGLRRQPDRDVEADASVSSVSLLQDPAGEPLVRDHDPLLGRRAQDRVVEPHVLDDAVVALERHPVADADRLRDREHDPGDEVGQRLARGEADDRGGDRARGEQAGRRRCRGPVKPESATTMPISERSPRRQPAHEAQPRVAPLGDAAAQHPAGEPRRARAERAVDHDASEDDDRKIARPRVIARRATVDQCQYRVASHGAPQPRAILLDALGTLLTFEPPAPHLRARAARARAPTSASGGAGGDPRRDRLLPRAPARGAATRPALAACAGAARRRCGRAAEPAASLGGDALTRAAGRAALPRLPRRRPALRALRAPRDPRSSSSPTGTCRCTSGSHETGLAPLVDGALASAEVGAAKPDRRHLRARRWSSPAPRRRRPGTSATRPRPTSRARARPALHAGADRPRRGARPPAWPIACSTATLAGCYIPHPSGPEPPAPELPDELPPDRVRRSRRRRRGATSCRAWPAVGAVRGDAGDAR